MQNVQSDRKPLESNFKKIIVETEKDLTTSANF